MNKIDQQTTKIANEALLEQLLNNLVGDISDHPDFKDTPQRVAKMWNHFFRDENPEIHFKKSFPTTNKEIVMVRDIRALSMCPHHLMPIEYKVHIGYVPQGQALGLSKLSRIARAVASTPILQENFTTKIAELFEKHLDVAGVMVVVQGVHGCMKYRGVKEQESETITSEIRGVFAKNAEARKEFLSLLGIKSI